MYVPDWKTNNVRSLVKAGCLAAICCTGPGLAGYAGTPEISRAELESRYVLPSSKFMEIGGTRIHYTDAGSGQVVVLLPPSYMNLRVWDATADILARDFRVIRIDFPVVGLSGPDPDRNYSMEHFGEILHGLTTALGIGKFDLVGTSLGGIVAFQYASRWPGRVERLALINSAGLPRTVPLNSRSAGSSAYSNQYSSREAWQQTLDAQMGSDKPAPAELVTLVYDLNRREGLAEDSEIVLKQFRTGDPQTVLAGIRAPTLIIWGKRNMTLSHLEANIFELWLSGAPSMVVKYDDLGHYPYVEDPQRVAADLGAFFKGERDGELARTIRLPVMEPAR